MPHLATLCLCLLPAALMPVAKLSRAFYERFGDALTDELVNCLSSIEGSYRAELRDLFDAQFGRFEEKLERRLAETTALLRSEIVSAKEELRTEMVAQLRSLRTHLGSLRAELNGVKERLGMLKGSSAV
jgi:hypothetical protein